jgi:hypothetical protein
MPGSPGSGSWLTGVQETAPQKQYLRLVSVKRGWQLAVCESLQTALRNGSSSISGWSYQDGRCASAAGRPWDGAAAAARWLLGAIGGCHGHLRNRSDLGLCVGAWARYSWFYGLAERVLLGCLRGAGDRQSDSARWRMIASQCAIRCDEQARAIACVVPALASLAMLRS